MPRISAKVNYNTFISGKVSDSNPLNSPENTARTLLNVDIENNGKIGRRLGLEPEEDFNLPSLDGEWLPGYSLDNIQDIGVDTFQWEEVSGIPGLTYQCVRVGNLIYVYNEAGTVLSNSLVTTVDISGFAVSGGDDSERFDLQAVSGKGLLVCTGSRYNPFYIKYDEPSNTFSTSQIDIRIRDFKGADTTYEPNYRPNNLTAEHKYNLFNQGWTNSLINSFKTGSGNYPSNADIASLGNTTDSSGNPTWKYELVTTTLAGNSQAPRGHFILDPFLANSQQTASGVSILGKGYSTRPKAVAFFAGRCFYGSVDGNIYYSQIISSEGEVGKCYQDQDPTAEDFNALLDTDGGVLQILDIGDVEKMVPMGDALVILGSSGIYMLSGGDSGFSANIQLLTKVSEISLTNYRSVVPAEGAIFFWTEEGIYYIGGGKDGYTPQSLSENKIQQDYNNIPATAKAFAQGTYDRVERKVYWAYSNYTADVAADIRHKYTDVLVFDVSLASFWDYRLSNTGFSDSDTDYPFMAGILNPSFKKSGVAEQPIYEYEADAGIFGGNGTGNFRSTSDFLTYEEEVSDFPGPRIVAQMLHIPGTSRAVALLTNHDVAITDDGLNWTTTATNIDNGEPTGVRSDPYSQAQSMSYSPDINMLVIGISSGVAYSADLGSTWGFTLFQGVAGLDAEPSEPDGCVGSRGVFWDSERSRFLALPTHFAPGVAPYAVSGDGINWTAATASVPTLPAPSYKLGHYAYSELLDVIVLILFDNSSSTGGARLVSINGGSTWTVSGVSSFSGTAFDGIVYGGGKFLMVDAYNHEIVSSVDGLAWAGTTPTGSLDLDPINPQRFDLKYSPQFGKYLCFIEGLLDVHVSDDGLAWSPITVPLSNSVVAYTDYPNTGQGAVEVLQTDFNGPVQDVCVESLVQTYVKASLKVLMFLPDNFGDLRPTFGQFSSRTFHDWAGLSEEELEANSNYTSLFPVMTMASGNYISIVETLPLTLGEPSVVKNVTYATTYYDYRRGGYNTPFTYTEFDE